MGEKVKLVSPVGSLQYVHISGQGKQNYNEDGYEYVATIYLDKSKPEVKAFMEQIDEIRSGCPKDKTMQAEGYKTVYADEEGKLFVETDNKKFDKELHKETGLISVQYKTKTTFTDGKTKKIAVYNAKGKKVELGERRIGNGTTGALSGASEVYVNGKKTGVSIYLSSVQVVKFVEYVDDGGFAEQEGDFDGFDDEGDFETKPASEDKPVEEAKTEKVKPRL